MTVASSNFVTPGRRDPLIRQAEAGECGLACLAMVAQHHRDLGGLAELRRRFPLSSRGASLKDLVTISDQMGFHTRALQSDIASLAQLSLPAILHWDLNHYVVLSEVRRKRAAARYTILDPAAGMRILDQEMLAEHFTGIVLELTPTASFAPNPRPPRLQLAQLWTRAQGIWAALGRILTLALVMQLVVLVTPLYMQLAIDTALPAMDVDLLNVIAVAFALILILNAATSWVRSRLILNLSNSLAMQTAVNLFRHTMFLPIAWFEKRHLGDVVSRFTSLQPITDLLSRGLVASFVDGALAVTTLILMIIYSPILTALTTGLILAYGGTKLAFYKSMKYANANVLSAQAVESSAFMENVRGIAPIKMFCQEGNRQRLWQNKKADVVNGTVRLGRMSAAFDTINSLIVGLENIGFVYVAISMVMDGSISVGMVFAYQAYKQNFVGAVTRLIDQLLNYRLLDVHLDRLSDIALERREPDALLGDGQGIRSIEFENVSFTYGMGLPLVLRGVNLRIEAGKTTAIVGVSGSGKTTLVKILCGLLDPTAGRVIVNGMPLHQYGVRKYRNQLGVVSQDDTLFGGSLAENIAFFDSDYAMPHVEAVAAQAAIHDDIMRMPMRYDTMVGDMGSNLSGGQKQRVLLARALYKGPAILVLDEGTAHLDVVTEEKVVDALKKLDATRILVAHRPETIRMADVIIRIAGGHATIMQDTPFERPVLPAQLAG